MTKQVINFLEGRWHILESHYFTDGAWRLYQKFETNEFVFDFEQDSLRDRCCYDSEKQELILDVSSYLEDGECDIVVEEIYEVEYNDETSHSCQLNLINEPDNPHPYFRYICHR